MILSKDIGDERFLHKLCNFREKAMLIDIGCWSRHGNYAVVMPFRARSVHTHCKVLIRFLGRGILLMLKDQIKSYILSSFIFTIY